MYVCIYVRMYVYTCACIHAYIHTYVCMYTHVHAYMHTYIGICVYIRMYVCTYVRTYVYTCACIHAYIHKAFWLMEKEMDTLYRKCTFTASSSAISQQSPEPQAGGYASNRFTCLSAHSRFNSTSLLSLVCFHLSAYVCLYQL